MQPVPNELAHIECSPGARHEALLRGARRLEGNHDEYGVAVGVRGRNRLFEEHDAAGVVDLVIHEADEGLRRHGTLGVCAIARLHAQVIRARHDVGRQLIRSGDARAANLELV